MNEQIETFLKSADAHLIGAVRSVCRKKYPKTVKTLDGLSALELEAIRNGGLLSLPKPKLNKLRTAMTKDNFQFSAV